MKSLLIILTFFIPILTIELINVIVDHEMTVLIRIITQFYPQKVSENCVFQVFKSNKTAENVTEKDVEEMKKKLVNFDDNLKKKVWMINASLPLCVENEFEVNKKFFDENFLQSARKNQENITLECAKAAHAVFFEKPKNSTEDDCKEVLKLYHPLTTQEVTTENLLDVCINLKKDFFTISKLKALILVLSNASEEKIEKRRVEFAGEFREMNAFHFACVVNTSY